MISPGDSIRQDPSDFGAGDEFVAGDLSDRGVGSTGTAQMDQPKSEEVKDRASRVVQDAKGALGQASHALADQAKAAGSELRAAAGRVTGEATHRLSDQAVARKDFVAGQVSSLGAAVRDAAQRLEGDRSPAAVYVRTAADGLDHVADYLKNADLRDLYGEAERFTRRHPEVVLGGLFIVGVGIARFLKASAEERRAEAFRGRDVSLNPSGDFGAMRPVGQYGVGGTEGYNRGSSYSNPAYSGSELGTTGSFPSGRTADVGTSGFGIEAGPIGSDDVSRADELVTDFDASGFGNTSEFRDPGPAGGSLGASCPPGTVRRDDDAI